MLKLLNSLSKGTLGFIRGAIQLFGWLMLVSAGMMILVCAMATVISPFTKQGFQFVWWDDIGSALIVGAIMVFIGRIIPNIRFERPDQA